MVGIGSGLCAERNGAAAREREVEIDALLRFDCSGQRPVRMMDSEEAPWSGSRRGA